MGFLRQEQESWSVLPFPSPGDVPNPGIEPKSPALAGEFFTTEPLGKEASSTFCNCFFFNHSLSFSASFHFPSLSQVLKELLILVWQNKRKQKLAGRIIPL